MTCLWKRRAASVARDNPGATSDGPAPAAWRSPLRASGPKRSWFRCIDSDLEHLTFRSRGLFFNSLYDKETMWGWPRSDTNNAVFQRIELRVGNVDRPAMDAAVRRLRNALTLGVESETCFSRGHETCFRVKRVTPRPPRRPWQCPGRRVLGLDRRVPLVVVIAVRKAARAKVREIRAFLRTDNQLGLAGDIEPRNRASMLRTSST